jgi:PTS system ascorbate-specific IIA component
MPVSNTCKPDQLVCEARRICNKINDGDGVLILTDIFGSTPSNICNKLKSDCQAETHVIAGLNLPMLVRALNYPELTLAEIADKAFSGAQDGIIDCQALS